MKKFPWIDQESEQQLYIEAASKIERGEPLAGGDGSNFLERPVIVAVLRALSEGIRPGKVLRVGAKPKQPYYVTIAEVHRKVNQHGSKAAAFRAIDKANVLNGKSSTGAAEKAYKRAIKKQHDIYREKYMAGEWPTFSLENMYEELVVNSPFFAPDGLIKLKEFCDKRHTADLQIFFEFTGWKTPPDRGQK